MEVMTGILVQKEVLFDFCLRAFLEVGVTKKDAPITAEVLVAADLRGIPSHGMSRLRRYIHGIQTGMIRVDAQWQVVREFGAITVIDADGGLGQPVSCEATMLVIRKALEYGIALAEVRNSNHFGYAGHFPMMALEEGCIALALTNTAPLVTPTFGRQPILGSNAMAIAFPAGKQRAVVVDMSTSTVPRGKVEVYNRTGKPLPAGWAVDHRGQPTDNASLVLENLKDRVGGGLLPLGGVGEEQGGHKGYCLALAVEIFTAILSGAAFGLNTYPKTPDGCSLPANLGHTFAALNIEAFRPLDEYRADMDELILMIKDSAKADGQARIWIPGEKEFEAAERNARDGIPMEEKVLADLDQLALELKIPSGLV